MFRAKNIRLPSPVVLLLRREPWGFLIPPSIMLIIMGGINCLSPSVTYLWGRSFRVITRGLVHRLCSSFPPYLTHQVCQPPQNLPPVTMGLIWSAIKRLFFRPLALISFGFGLLFLMGIVVTNRSRWSGSVRRDDIGYFK